MYSVLFSLSYYLLTRPDLPQEREKLTYAEIHRRTRTSLCKKFVSGPARPGHCPAGTRPARAACCPACCRRTPRRGPPPTRSRTSCCHRCRPPPTSSPTQTPSTDHRARAPGAWSRRAGARAGAGAGRRGAGVVTASLTWLIAPLSVLVPACSCSLGALRGGNKSPNSCTSKICKFVLIRKIFRNISLICVNFPSCVNFR